MTIGSRKPKYSSRTQRYKAKNVKGATLIGLLIGAALIACATFGVLSLFLASRTTYYGMRSSAVAYRETANFINLKSELYKLPADINYNKHFMEVNGIPVANGNMEGEVKKLAPAYSGIYGYKLTLKVPLPLMSGKNYITHSIDVFGAR